MPHLVIALVRSAQRLGRKKPVVRQGRKTPKWAEFARKYEERGLPTHRNAGERRPVASPGRLLAGLSARISPLLLAELEAGCVESAQSIAAMP